MESRVVKFRGGEGTMTLVSLTRVVDESEKISSYPLELGPRGELCEEVPFLR